MLEISFYSDYDKPEYLPAIREYQNIWISEGLRVVVTLEAKTGFQFIENKINAIIYEGVSQSHPLSLRASYDLDTKKSTIVHELLHRLLLCNKVVPFSKDRKEQSLISHKQIDLVLYDIWTELYGEEFAQKSMVVESARTEMYKEAWEWAMQFDKDERKVRFEKSITERKL